jgi:hypothetical protein
MQFLAEPVQETDGTVEKKEYNYPASLHFACAIIVWRQIIPVHPGLIPG